ncbi:MAG: Ig domain-containing protein [Pseudomonadota bacterium]
MSLSLNRRLLVSLQARPDWSASAVSATLQILGLIGGEARPNSATSLSAQMSDATPISSYRWGYTEGGQEFGTGPTPTDIALADGGMLYLEAVAGGQTYEISVPVRFEQPHTTGPLADREYTVAVAIPPNDLSSAFAGDNLTITLSPTSDPLPTGLNLSPAGIVTGTPTEAADRSLIVRATNSGGFAENTLEIETLDLAVFDFGDGTFALTYGGDTEETLSLIVDGNAYNQDVFGNPIDASLFAALNPGDAAPIKLPELSIAVDGGDIGVLEAGDEVRVAEPGFWIYGSGQSAPTIVRDWFDQSGSIQADANPYILTGSEQSIVFAREQAGSITMDSASLPVASSFAFADDFNRADETLITSANWEAHRSSTTGSVEVLGNQLTLVSSGANFFKDGAKVSGISLASNQYVECDFVSFGNPTLGINLFQLYLRISSDTEYYAVQFVSNGDGQIFKNGATLQTFSHSLTGNERIRFEAKGTTVNAYVNGSLVVTTTDSDEISGVAGLRFYTDRPGDPSSTIDNFACGNL